MSIKQRTYVLLALAGLLALVGAILDLWFYTVGAIAVGLYVAGRLFAFRSIVDQLDIHIEREATREARGKDIRAIVSVSLCSNLNVGGFFFDLIPEDFELEGPIDPPLLSLTKGEQVNVRYVLRAARDVDLNISRSAFTIETDLFAHTLYFTTTPAAAERPAPSRAVGGPARAGRQLGTGLTDEPEHGTRTTQRTGIGYELSHVRPYASTDPANRIDWKTSAKLNELMIKVFFVEPEDSIGFGAPITVVVDQSGGLDGAAEGQTARDISAQIVEYIARFASDNESLMSVVTYDNEDVTSVALGETPSHVSQWVGSLERPRAEPVLRKPVRRKSGITNIEVQRFEKGFSPQEGGEGARFREVISYLYARKERYLSELERSPAYQATAHLGAPSLQRGAIILISDLENDVDPLIEGIRSASYAGSRVYVVSFFSKLFQSVRDAFISAEDLYGDYERYKVRLSKVASVPEVKVVEAPSADYLTFLERGDID